MLNYIAVRIHIGRLESSFDLEGVGEVITQR